MHLALFSRHAGGVFERQRIPAAKRAGAIASLAISVDVTRPHADLAADTQQKLGAAGSAVLALLAQLQLPTTWGLPEPWTSPLAEQLSGAGRETPPHELAVRWEATWRHPRPRRMALADALSRIDRYCLLSGRKITTLFADESLLAGNYDLLTKRGVTAVCDVAPQRGGTSHSPAPRQLRYGLWHFPVAQVVPSERPLAVGKLGRFVASRRGAAVASTGVLHVSIELSRLTSGSRTAWRGLEQTLRHVARLRADDGVQTETLQSLADRLSSVPVAAPQRSILKRAA